MEIKRSIRALLRIALPLCAAFPASTIRGEAPASGAGCDYRGLGSGTVQVVQSSSSAPVDYERAADGNPNRIDIHLPNVEPYTTGALVEPLGRYQGTIPKSADYAPILAHVAAMAERGYVLSDTWVDKDQVRLFFYAKRELIPASAKEPEPDWVTEQRRLLREHYPKSDGYIPAKLAIDNAGVAGGTFLTKANLQKLEIGTYQWVRIRGENFLRVGQKGHQKLSGGEDVLGGGEIKIVKKDGANQVTVMTNKTGTYFDRPDFMVNGVEALWRQGIFPEELQMLSCCDMKDEPMHSYTIKKP